MATQLQVRRGTTSELQSFTGAEGEITVDTDKDTLVVHDGSTAGGHPLLRADAALGFTLTEHFIASGTYTKTGKTGLKRIRVEAWGGGGGGGMGQNNNYGGSGGGQGGHGIITIEVGNLTDNVSVTIGAGGSGVAEASVNTAGTDGGDTIFGSYMTCHGGEGGYIGNYDESNLNGALGGRVTGTGVDSAGDLPDSDGSGRLTGAINLGAHPGTSGHYFVNNYEASGNGGGPGAGVVDFQDTNNDRRNAVGYQGGGGAGASPAAGVGISSGNGAQGSLIVYEIYGEV